jgi:hypothetical protein
MMAIKPQHEIIVIPRSARGQVLLGFPLSTRLANVLRLQAIQRFSELHGLTFDEISQFRNCGSTTVQELRRLIQNVRAGRKPDPAGAGRIPAYEFFQVPKYARQFRPADLPLSVRLENVLKCNGVVRLADLRERTPCDFKRLANCDRVTCDELVRLMVRVAAGEFRPVVPSFSITKLSPALRPLDEAVAALPEDWRSILLFYSGNDPSGPGTMRETGNRFHLTSSRIGQIVECSVEKIRKAAGLRMRAYLDGMAAFCQAQVCPLTPALFAHWLTESRAAVHYRPETYVWLLEKLTPAIPVWRHGQDFQKMSERDREISSALATVLRANGKVLPFKEAWKLVRTNKRQRRPSRREFLDALKHARTLLTVDFPTPSAGTVRLRGRPGSLAKKS